MTDRETIERQAREDFERWCYSMRPLGRDRLWPAFEAGYAHGYAYGVDARTPGADRDFSCADVTRPWQRRKDDGQ